MVETVDGDAGWPEHIFETLMRRPWISLIQ